MRWHCRCICVCMYFYNYYIIYIYMRLFKYCHFLCLLFYVLIMYLVIFLCACMCVCMYLHTRSFEQCSKPLLVDTWGYTIQYYPIYGYIYILYIYGGLSLADHNPWGNVPFANSQWSVRHPAVIHPSRAERGDLTWDFSPWPWLLWWWKAFAGAFLGIVGAWSTDVHGRETRRSNLEWDKGWWHISRSSKCVLVLFGTRMCCQSI